MKSKKHPKDTPALILKTGMPIIVYKLKSGKWCDAINCKDQYDENELKFLKS